jgi:hypothetical protein
MDILEFGCPTSWQKQMILQAFEPVTSLAAEMVRFYKRIECAEDGPEPIQKAQEKSSNNGKKVNSPSNRGSNKDCLIQRKNCGHNSNDCRTLKFQQAEKMKQTHAA